MVAGVHRSANNIFENSHDSLSRVRTDYSGASESDFRDLSRKDRNSVTDIQKDELEYQIDDNMFEQQKEWDKEEWERIFS